MYAGTEVVPGAREALQRVTDAGLQVRFLTNTTTKTAHEVATKLKSLGFVIEERNIFSAVTAARQYLSGYSNGGSLPSLHLLVRQSVMGEFAGFPHANLETGEGAPQLRRGG